MQNAIEVSKLSKVYKDGFQALNELSITVKKGGMFILLGEIA